MALVDHVKGLGYNITADNWFTSIEVIETLRHLGMTNVGSVKKNGRKIHPLSLLAIKGSPTRPYSKIETI